MNLRIAGPMMRCAVTLTLLAACEDAENERAALRDTHRSEVVQVLDTLEGQHLAGVEAAASKLTAGFALPVEQQAEEFRKALRIFQDPTRPPSRAVRELTASPMTFMVALASDGTVITRDVRNPDNDDFRGQDWRERFPLVRNVFQSQSTRHGPAQFAALENEQNTIWLFASPCLKDGVVVGAVALGIPLRNLAELLTRQLQLNHSKTKGLELWVYGFDGGRLAHKGTPVLIDQLVPDAKIRSQGLASSPAGFAGEVSKRGRPFGWWVMPAPRLGSNVGFVLLRSDPR